MRKTRDMPQSNYDQLNTKLDSILARIGELSTSMAVNDEAHRNITAKLADMVEQGKVRNGRIGKLETWRTLIIGGGIILLSVLGVFGKVVLEHLAKQP